MRERSLLPVFLIALSLAPSVAAAQDECASDDDCARLYRAGFRCVDGTSARYCVEPSCGSGPYEGAGSPCDTDADCVSACGDATICDVHECQPRVLCVEDGECDRTDTWTGAIMNGWCDRGVDRMDDVGVCSWSTPCDEDADCERTEMWTDEIERGWCDTSRPFSHFAGYCAWTERPHYFYGCAAGPGRSLPPLAALVVLLFLAVRRR